MKIVQINSSCGSGSTGKISLAIKKKLDDIDVENYIFYSGYKICEYDNCIPINTIKDIRKHQLLSLVFGDQGWHSIRETNKLVELLKKINPDVVHLHNLHGYYLNMDILFDYLSKCNVPVIWTLHDCWAFTGHCAYFTSAKCEKWKTCCYNCAQYKKYPYSLFFDRSKQLFKRKGNLYKYIDNLTITTVSKWLRCITSQSALLNDRKILVISNGIDTKVFSPKEQLYNLQGFSLCNKKIVLGVANTWSERKGLNLFKEMRSLLSDEYLIILVGLNEEQIKSLPVGIIGLKRTRNAQELADIYSSANVFVNASTEETFGLTTIEAISCGTPAIVFNSTACPEPITSNMYGSIVSTGDICYLIKEVEYWCGQDKNVNKTKLHEYIVNNYDEEKVYDNYINLYKEVCR